MAGGGQGALCLAEQQLLSLWWVHREGPPYRTMPQACLCPRGIWKYWGELLAIMVLHCARAGEGSWGWSGVNTEQVLIKCQECSRRNEKKEIYGRRRTLLIALVKCKCVGRKCDVYWQGQKSSQNRCILVMRVRTLCRAISFPQDTPA